MSCTCEHWQVCDECRPKEWRNYMTLENKAKVEWLNDMNQHLAAGGKLELLQATNRFEATSGFPGWGSDPKHWRKVPLPRRATLFLAYRWNIDGSFIHKTVDASQVVCYHNVGGWRVKEIELEETP